jgi:hypothetical protein
MVLTLAGTYITNRLERTTLTPALSQRERKLKTEATV